jgi:hypothetical protein
LNINILWLQFYFEGVINHTSKWNGRKSKRKIFKFRFQNFKCKCYISRQTFLFGDIWIWKIIQLIFPSSEHHFCKMSDTTNRKHKTALNKIRLSLFWIRWLTQWNDGFKNGDNGVTNRKDNTIFDEISLSFVYG